MYAGKFGCEPCCDYWDIAGHLRGCDPGPYCERYQQAPRREKKRVSIELPKRQKKEPAPHVPRFSINTEIAQRLYGAGYGDGQIAAQLGCSAETVRRWRGRNGLPVNSGTVAMQAHARELTFDVSRARELHASGLSDKAVADAVGVAPATIQRWRMKNGIAANKKHKTKKERCK